MPLSEHEQRLLDQIERALYADDPKFASAVRTADLRTHYRRRIVRGVTVFVVGLVMLPVGMVTAQYAVTIIGFLVMLGGVLYAATSWKRSNGQPEPRPSRSKLGASGSRRAKVMDRLNERWQRRWDQR